jgi:hypothetical protein
MDALNDGCRCGDATTDNARSVLFTNFGAASKRDK